MQKRFFLSVTVTLISSFSAAAVDAQQTIHDGSGSPFMEEVTDGKPHPSHGISPQAQPDGQAIRGKDGSMFMEEVPQKKKVRPAPRPAVDYSSLGVPVDSSGKIIPLIQPGGGPVMPNYSRMEIDYTPPTVYVPYSTYSGPYGYVPQRTPFGTYPVPVYRPQFNGVMAVPMGIPRSYTSSSDALPGGQETKFQFSGSYLNGAPAASIWSPGWRSPWGGAAWVPQRTQFEQKGTIRSFFPQNLNP